MVLPDPGRSRVVLIGTSRFADPELPDLPAVRNNLDGLADCLAGAGRCTVVADPASPIDLVDPVHDAASAAEDTLLIYYAGHGLVHPRTLALLLAVVGSAPGRTHTAVPYDLVRENVLESPATRKVVILDCCYSGRALGGMADPTTAVANEATVEGTYLLASAPPNKQALSPPGETFTAFTGALVTLLREGIPNGPRDLHLNLIYRYVRDALRRSARPEPQLRADNTAGDLVLVRNPWHLPPARPPVLEPIPDIPIIDFSPAKRDVRGRLKELLRDAGLENSYACPVCDVTVTGQNLVRHVDKHQPADWIWLDPATLTLTIRPTKHPGRAKRAERYQPGEPLSDTVFLGMDTKTEKPVVLKQEQFDPRLLELYHPVIETVYDFQPPYTVLEYIDGRPVADVVPVQPARAVEIITKICEALVYAHENGIAHGDINSGNVLLTPEGAVKILNVGCRTVPDSRTDLYAVARLLVELLTGSPPAFGAPVSPAIPPELAPIVRKAMHPDLIERYQTAGELMRALKR